jgi:G3E family GTPase
MVPIPVTIVTGFLGAGKTSLLNEMLADPAFAGTAVLINEFGEVSIDHDLVAEFSEELIVTKTGCLCCTASSDIKQSLFELWQKRKERKIRAFDRVIVETTGLVDPVPVVHALLAPPLVGLVDRIVTGQFALARVVTLFDIINGDATLDDHLEALKQIALADAVILTKTDLARDPATLRDVETVRARLRQINPAALLFDRQTDRDAVRALLLAPGTYDLRTKGEDAAAWLGAEALLGAQDHGHTHDDRTRHGTDIRSHVVMIDEPISPLVFHFFLDALKLSAGRDLLRFKGLFALSDDPDRPVVVHGVQQLVHPIDKLDAWPSADRRTRFVVIGRNLNVDAMRSILASGKPASRAGASGLVRAAVALAAIAAALLAGNALLASPEPQLPLQQSNSHVTKETAKP